MNPPVIRLSEDTYLSTKDGVIVTKDQAEDLISKAVIRAKNLVVDQNVQLLSGRDACVVNLALTTINGNVPPTQGFLVRVYLSGSDGSLKRMYKNPIIDPADNSIVRDSYDQYIEMEFDV